MKESNKCPNCGATIKYNEDKSVGKCPYCNSTFDGEKSIPTQTATIKDLQIDEDEEGENKKSKFSLFLFIILFMINPLFAIIYLLLKIFKK